MSTLVDIKTDAAPMRKRNSAFRGLPAVPVEQSHQQLKLSAIEERLIAEFRQVGSERQHMIAKFTHSSMVQEVERASKGAPRFVLIQGGAR